MIIPQGYPLYAASVFMAGDAKVERKDRTCFHNPGENDVRMSRIIGWEITEGFLPVPISDTAGYLSGHWTTTHETESAARIETARLAAIVDAFWAAHNDCDGECPQASVWLGEAPSTK